MTDSDHKFSRREFVVTASKTVALLAFVAKTGPIAFAGESHLPESELTLDGQVLRVHAGPAHVFKSPIHVHTFDIPMDVLRNPPKKGYATKSTVSSYPFVHQHEIKLSHRKLEKIWKGETVSLFDRNLDHTWKIRLA